jgi:hypothetical protein
LNVSDREPRFRWRPGAALAAWLLPGLGHYLLGERRRGAILAASIGILWLAGFIIGGISVFDHQDRAEYIVAVGQVFMAPSIAVDAYLQREIKPRYPGSQRPEAPNGYEPSLGRVSEQGILYTALAGYLNLLAIIDVLYRDPRRRDASRPAAELPTGEDR